MLLADMKGMLRMHRSRRLKSMVGFFSYSMPF